LGAVWLPANGDVMIRPEYRDEFEQLGAFDLTKRLNVGLYDEDKRKAARLWLDEQEHGEDRTYRAEQLKLQRRADLKTTIALILSAIAIVISVWAKYSQTATFP
jgi:hypothetical protein